MNNPIVLNSAKALSAWLERIGPGGRRRYYARLFLPHVLVLADQPSVPFSQLPWGRGEGMIDLTGEIEIPQLKDARVWWNAIWENETAEFWLYEDAPIRILCVAKVGVWSTVPRLYTDYPRTAFRTIAEDEFRAIAGEALSREMLRELGAIGVSVRRLLHVV